LDGNGVAVGGGPTLHGLETQLGHIQVGLGYGDLIFMFALCLLQAYLGTFQFELGAFEFAL
jgi:hypothetical protein